MKTGFNTLYLLAALLPITLWSCGGHNHGSDAEADEHDHEHPEGQIVLEPDVAGRLGVEVAALAPQPFVSTVETWGTLEASPADQAVVAAPTAGKVTLTPQAQPGATVGAGAVLARVSAAGMSGGSADEAARRELEAARRELERAAPLAEQGIVTAREYNDIKARYEAAQAAFSPAAASGAATSPIAGTVTAVLVGQGQYVEAGAPIATVSRSATLRLRADLPVRYQGLLPTVSGAMVELPGGGFVDAAPVATPQAAAAQGGYCPVWFAVPATAGLAPGATVTVHVKAGGASERLAVPVTAVSEQQGAHYIYVKVGAHAYERRAVTLGQRGGDSVEVASGLQPGDSVVVRGISAVRLAENSGAVPDPHSH